MGAPLSTLYAELAANKIAQKLEDLMFTNTSYSFGGGVIYSYVNFPDRNAVNLAVDWDNAAITAALILADVLAMKQALLDVHKNGPYMLYVPRAYDTQLDADYNIAVPGVTIRDRIKMVDGISGVHVVDRLAANTVLLVEMQKSTVRLLNGLPLQNIMWSEEGKFVNKFKVITIQIPEIRSDMDGNCGVCVLS